MATKTKTKKSAKRRASSKPVKVKAKPCVACVAAKKARPNKAVSRDLCATCLAHARAMIGRGEITEARLIERGLMAPAQNRGPKPVNGLAKALEG